MICFGDVCICCYYDRRWFCVQKSCSDQGPSVCTGTMPLGDFGALPLETPFLSDVCVGNFLWEFVLSDLIVFIFYILYFLIFVCHKFLLSEDRTDFQKQLSWKLVSIHTADGSTLTLNIHEACCVLLFFHVFSRKCFFFFFFFSLRFLFGTKKLVMVRCWKYAGGAPLADTVSSRAGLELAFLLWPK